MHANEKINKFIPWGLSPKIFSFPVFPFLTAHSSHRVNPLPLEFSSFLSPLLLDRAPVKTEPSGFGRVLWSKYETWLMLKVPIPPGRKCSTEVGGTGGGGLSTFISFLLLAFLFRSCGSRKSCVLRQPPAQSDIKLYNQNQKKYSLPHCNKKSLITSWLA